jgi:hypothetical protein
MRLRASHALSCLCLLLALNSLGCRGLEMGVDKTGEARGGPPHLSYLIGLDEEGDLSVEITLPEGGMPGYWSLPLGRNGVDGVAYEVQGGAFEMSRVDANGVTEIPREAVRITYTYPLSQTIRRGSLKAGAGGGGSYVLSGHAYLLRWHRLSEDTRVELRYTGLDALLPWEADEDGVFRGTAWRLWDPGFHALGGRRLEVDVEGTRYRVALLDGQIDATNEEVSAWIERAGRELLTLCDPLPFPHLTVVLAPLAGSTEASSFGMILWSDPPSVAIYVGEHATAEEFHEDWVLIHEMSHSLHPALVPRENWLTEGMATYLSILARIRSGRYDARRGWQEVVSGVHRGLGQIEGRTLRELSEEMHARHAYMAVYWGGTVFSLHLDATLRRVTSGRRSLEHVLDVLRSRTAHLETDLETFGEVVDEVAGSPIFAGLLSQHLERECLADVWEILDELGIEGEHELEIGDEGAGAAVRRAIEIGRP